MNSNHLLSFLLLFTFFSATAAEKKDAEHLSTISQKTNSLQQAGKAQSHMPSGKSTIVPFLADIDTNGRHEHEDGKMHFFYFDRIRRKPAGFSIRCCGIRLLLILTHLAVLLIMACNFTHELQEPLISKKENVISNHWAHHDPSTIQQSFLMQNTTGKTGR